MDGSYWPTSCADIARSTRGYGGDRAGAHEQAGGRVDRSGTVMPAPSCERCFSANRYRERVFQAASCTAAAVAHAKAAGEVDERDVAVPGPDEADADGRAADLEQRGRERGRAEDAGRGR